MAGDASVHNHAACCQLAISKSKLTCTGFPRHNRQPTNLALLWVEGEEISLPPNLEYNLFLSARDSSDGWSLDWIVLREEIYSGGYSGNDGRTAEGGKTLTRFYSTAKGTMINDDIEDERVGNIRLTTANCGHTDRGAAAAGFLTKVMSGKNVNIEPYAGHASKQVSLPYLLPKRCMCATLSFWNVLLCQVWYG